MEITLDPGNPLIRSRSITFMRMIDATVLLQSTQSELSLPGWEPYIVGFYQVARHGGRSLSLHVGLYAFLSFHISLTTQNQNIMIANVSAVHYPERQ
jgi:hypothetical protein